VLPGHRAFLLFASFAFLGCGANVGSVESVGKGRFFRGVLGFSEENLGPALEAHLIENFGSATIEGSRIRAVGTLLGPNGRVATVQSVWQVTADGFVDFITAVPK